MARRTDVHIPQNYSAELAEFFGVMLGDGHLSPTQIKVTLGTKELKYAEYISRLIKNLFGPIPKISISSAGHRTIYLGSTEIANWLRKERLVSNKVKSQVDIPFWIFSREKYMSNFLRGFFDTDGSVYRLRHGIQLSFTNASRPMLESLQRLCCGLGYRVSAISGRCFYLTKIREIERFFKEVAPKNEKHMERFSSFFAEYRALRAGGRVAKYNTL